MFLSFPSACNTSFTGSFSESLNDAKVASDVQPSCFKAIARGNLYLTKIHFRCGDDYIGGEESELILLFFFRQERMLVFS